MTTLRPKEVRDHTLVNDETRMISEHKALRTTEVQRRPEREQVLELVFEPGPSWFPGRLAFCCLTLCWAEPIAHCPSNTPLPQIMTLANIYCLIFFATKPHPSASLRPSRPLLLDPWLEWAAPSLLSTPAMIYCIPLTTFTNLHPELQLPSRSFRGGGGLCWVGVWHWLS